MAKKSPLGTGAPRTPPRAPVNQPGTMARKTKQRAKR